MAEAFRSLALKYRPQFFGDIVGQGATARALAQTAALGRAHAAYLFHGPRGCGKTSMARLLAKALNCRRRPEAAAAGSSGGEPCGVCPSCLDIAAGRSLDVLEIDAASHTGVEHVREVIIDTVNLSCARDVYRIFIIDEVHMLSGSAFNAMLKTLEEPPPHVLFILATTELHKVPATVISRTQSFPFRSPSSELIKERLAWVAGKEGFLFEPQALEEVAKAARGSFRDGLSILEQTARLAHAGSAVSKKDVHELLGFFNEDAADRLIEALVFHQDLPGAAALVKEALYSAGYTPNQILAGLYERSALKSLEKLHDAGSFAEARELRGFNAHLAQMLEQMRFSPDPILACEVGLLSYVLDAEKGPDLGDNKASDFPESPIKKPEKPPASAEPLIAEPIPTPLTEKKIDANVAIKQEFNGDWQKQYEGFLQAVKNESFGFYFEGSSLETPLTNDAACVVKLANSFYLKGVEKNRERVLILWRQFFGAGRLSFGQKAGVVAPSAGPMKTGAAAPVQPPVLAPDAAEQAPEELKNIAAFFGGKIKRLGS